MYRTKQGDPEFIDYIQHVLSKGTYIQVQLKIQATEHRRAHQIRQRMHLLETSLVGLGRGRGRRYLPTR